MGVLLSIDKKCVYTLDCASFVRPCLEHGLISTYSRLLPHGCRRISTNSNSGREILQMKIDRNWSTFGSTKQNNGSELQEIVFVCMLQTSLIRDLIEQYNSCLTRTLNVHLIFYQAKRGPALPRNVFRSSVCPFLMDFGQNSVRIFFF